MLHPTAAGKPDSTGEECVQGHAVRADKPARERRIARPRKRTSAGDSRGSG